MYDNYNYPPGADTPDAPWNQEEVPERTFDVFISQILSKSTRVTTNDYIHEVDLDEDGYHYNDDTSDTNWIEAYKNEHFTPLQLISELKDFLTKHLPDPVIDIKGFKEAKNLISECEGWVEDEIEVMRE